MADPNQDPNQNPGPNRGDEEQGSNEGGGRGSGGSGGPNGPRQPNFLSRGVLGWLLLGILLIALLVLMQGAQERAKEIPWQEFYQLARDGAFEGEIVIENERIVGELKDSAIPQDADAPGESPLRATKISPDNKTYYTFQLDQVDGVLTTEDPSTQVWMQMLIWWAPLILLMLLIYFFVFRSLRNAGGGPGMLGNFGRSKHRVLNKEHSDITLNDVAGVEEAKDEVSEIIEFLKNPKKFQRLGGRVPRGVLLIGAPGGGKTLLAKAVAGEADVPFFSISGSDFVEMFVGVGASRVRDLFKQAKESAPCIIFLDEIDAVGRKRGAGFSSGGHDEREQTLNAILVEMDGFDSSDQVIVMAATNREDVLDPALTRPGRFDRQIQVPLPDIKGRMQILKVHAKRVKMSPDVDLEKLARGTPMFSGADLAAIINEAAIGATLQNKEFVEQTDLEEARDKVKWGRARTSHRIEEDEKRVIAYHEAGHAVVMFMDPNSEPLHKVTIIPRGQALGVTFMLPEKDRHLYRRQQLLAQLRVCFGGRIAEDMFCGDVSSGAAHDIRTATRIARAMITEYGMSEKLGFLLYGNDEAQNPYGMPERQYSDETAKLIDDEVKALVDRTYEETQQMLETHRTQLDALAQALLKYETLTRDEVEKLMRGETLQKATVSELLEAEKDKQEQSTPQPGTQQDKGEADDDGTPEVMPSPA